MSVFWVSVSDGGIGIKSGYIYAAVLPAHRVLYIGQTRNALGAMGRFAQHVSQSSGSTLRSRVARHLGFDSVDLGPVEFLTWQLADTREYAGDSAVYREAVEAVAQAALLNALAQRRLGLVVLSHVERNGYCRMPQIVQAADMVAADMVSWLERLVDEKCLGAKQNG